MLNDQVKFAKKLYIWSISDWKREIKQGFPYLKNLGANLTIDILESLENSEKIKFSQAMVKRAIMPQVLEAIGESINETDQQYINLFLSKFNASFLVADSTGEKIIRANQDKVRFRNLKKSIVNALEPILGLDYENWGSWKAWRYTNRIGYWVIITEINIAAKAFDLSYFHSILNEKGEYLLNNYSILKWLGIASQTDWRLLTDSDAPSVIRQFTNLIDHFMKAISFLLEDISPI